jgi:hypothetical protein
VGRPDGELMESQPVTSTTAGMLPGKSNQVCGLTADVWGETAPKEKG